MLALIMLVIPPSSLPLPNGKVSDIELGRTLQFSRGSIVVFDKGYTDYKWFKALNSKGVFLVTRQRKNALWRVEERREVNKNTELTCDQTITKKSI